MLYFKIQVRYDNYGMCYIRKNTSYFNFGFYIDKSGSDKQAIVVSENALKRDILQLFLAYHDYELIQTNIIDIPQLYIYNSIEDFGNFDLMIELQKQNGYCIAPSEFDYLKGVFNNINYFKLKRDNKWLGYRLIETEESENGIIVSEYALKNNQLQKYIQALGYTLIKVSLPTHFSKIFYSLDDIEKYIRFYTNK